MSTTTIRDRHANGGQGMNFVRKDLRIALYLRDGLCCVYCQAAIEDGAKLTLDHLTPHSHGGKNSSDNMVTCCHKCNSSRGNRDWKAFAATVAEYLNHGIVAQQIIDHVETTTRRPVDRKQAKTILANRGGFTAAMQSLQ